MGVCVCVCSVMSDSAPEQWWMAVCVCVSVCSIVSDSVPEQVHMGVCVCVCACVLSCVQLFAPEQWHIGVVCVHVHAHAL